MTLIVAALQSEIDAVVAGMADSTEVSWNGFSRWIGSVAGSGVVVARCGVGKALASLVTQRLIDDIAPHRIILVGTAAALSASLRVKDTIVGSECIQHDVDATAVGLKKGEIPSLRIREIAGDSGLVAAASAVVPVEGTLHVGTIVTGDQVISGRETPERLRREFNAVAVDMESAAIALVAHVNAIPFVAVKTISDIPGEPTEMVFSRAASFASSNALHLVSQMLPAIETA